MRRGSYKTEAVVLNSHDFGESDRVLTFYTENFGKVSGIAKGARKSRRRFVGSLEPTVRIRLGFFSSGRGGLVRVESASIIEAFNSLRCDIALYSRACCMLELVSELTREAQVSRRVYTLLADSLRLLTPGGSPAPALYPPPGPRGPVAPAAFGAQQASSLRAADAVTRFFEIKLLSVLGYMPRLSGCVACGSPVPEISGSGAAGGGVLSAAEPARAYSSGNSGSEPAFFCSDRGGLVCRNCSSEPAGSHVAWGGAAYGSMVPVSRGTASLLATAIRFAPDKLLRLRPGDVFLRESELVLDTFIKHILGRELRTRVFIDKLARASF